MCKKSFWEFIKGLQSLLKILHKKNVVKKVVLYCNFCYFCSVMKRIIAYKNYYSDFMSKLSDIERKKILRALLLLETDDKIPYHYIKYIRDGVYELRINCGNNEFRIFFIYDGTTIVVLFNCFKKKTQKTPKSEIDKAITLKNEYYESKQRNL